jgi:hypothetical protein
MESDPALEHGVVAQPHVPEYPGGYCRKHYCDVCGSTDHDYLRAVHQSSCAPPFVRDQFRRRRYLGSGAERRAISLGRPGTALDRTRVRWPVPLGRYSSGGAPLDSRLRTSPTLTRTVLDQTRRIMVRQEVRLLQAAGPTDFRGRRRSAARLSPVPVIAA